MIEYLGLWILLAQTLNMWALLSVLAAKVSWTTKSFWAVCLFCLPGVGFFAWYLAGPRRTTV